MPFIKETFKYLKKSAFALIVLAAAPAVLFGLFFTPFSGFSFLPLYIKTADAGFGDIFWLIFSKRGITYVYPVLLALPVLITFGSYIMSVIEKHFKTGRLILHNPVRSVNNSVLTVLKILPLGAVVIVLLLLLQVSLISLIRLIITGTAGYPNVFDCFWTVILSAAFFGVSATVIAFMGAWAVIIQTFGFSFSDAFVEAIRITSRKWFSMIIGFLLPVVVLLIPIIVLNSLPPLPPPVKIIANTAIYLCLFVYYSAYIMVSVYKLTELNRRDKKRIVPKNVKYIK